MLTRMGLGSDAVMIIHGGGVFGDKDAAMQRFRENFRKLPKEVANRVVLENDEMCYNADDLLPICEELEIPFVFDYHARRFWSCVWLTLIRYDSTTG